MISYLIGAGVSLLLFICICVLILYVGHEDLPIFATLIGVLVTATSWVGVVVLILMLIMILNELEVFSSLNNFMKKPLIKGK